MLSGSPRLRQEFSVSVLESKEKQVEHKEQKSNVNYLIRHTFGCKMSAAGNCSSPQTNTSSEILLRNCHLSASTALLISRNLPKTWMFVFRELLLI